MKTRKFENVIIDVTDHFNDGFESPVPIAVLLNPDGTNAYDRYVRFKSYGYGRFLTVPKAFFGKAYIDLRKTHTVIVCYDVMDLVYIKQIDNVKLKVRRYFRAA